MTPIRSSMQALLVVLACSGCSNRNREVLARLRDQVAHGRAQGPVHRASLEEASLMLIVDSASLGYCLQYAAADVLQRAGYSVWTDNNPCLRGTRMTIFSQTDLWWRHATLTGYDIGAESAWSPEVSVSTDLDGKMTLRDVQLLVAKFTSASGFRKMVRATSASESAGLFVTTPLDPASIKGACGKGWPSSPAAIE